MVVSCTALSGSAFGFRRADHSVWADSLFSADLVLLCNRPGSNCPHDSPGFIPVDCRCRTRVYESSKPGGSHCPGPGPRVDHCQHFFRNPVFYTANRCPAGRKTAGRTNRRIGGCLSWFASLWPAAGRFNWYGRSRSALATVRNKS